MKALMSRDPRRLGNIRMIAVIGQGAMGRVLLGRTPAGRLVAVKQIHRHRVTDHGFRVRFEREVAASRQLTGAYTAAVVDSDTESENPWLATEYIAGPDLTSVIADSGPLPLSGLRLLATGLAAALVEIHRAGLVHRDLKPGNVLLTPEGPRVIDFGVARAHDDSAASTTAAGLVGSPAYMAPEQIEDQPLTPAADVFAVGAILTVAATGSPPFAGESTPQVLYNIVHSAPNLVGVPPAVRGLIDSCLLKDPAQRPSARELLEAAAATPVEPGWPEAVLAVIASYEADSAWWVRTGEQEALRQERVEANRIRRRARMRWAGAVAVAVLTASATLLGASRWTITSGHAQPMTDPSLTLTTTELRIIDPCKTLTLAFTDELGAGATPPGRGSSNLDRCGFSLANATNPQGRVGYELTIGDLGLTEDVPSTGNTVAWMPILGRSAPPWVEGGSCDRSVITQTGGHVALTMTVRTGGDDDVCPAAERALTSVVKQLTVYAPLRTVPSNSILRVEPCSILDPALARDIAGDPGGSEAALHSCTVRGEEGDVEVELVEKARPDLGFDVTPATVQVGPYTANADSEVDSGRCDLRYLVRPTTGDNGELVSVTVDRYRNRTDACGFAKKVLADVIPRLPQ